MSRVFCPMRPILLPFRVCVRLVAGKAIGTPLPLPHRVALAVLLGLGPTGSFSALTLHDLLQAVGVLD